MEAGFTFTEETDWQCPICLEPCSPNSVTTDCCQNVFCLACISRVRVCPLCRACPKPYHKLPRKVIRIFEQFMVSCDQCKGEMAFIQFSSHVCYPCKKCDRYFHSREALKQHKQKHFLPCPYCATLWKDQFRLNCHIEENHASYCHRCNRNFGSSSAFRQHEKAVHEFPCDYCHAIFHSRDAKEQHTHAKHLCPTCNNFCVDIQDHINDCHRCKYCQRYFARWKDLNQHKYAVHLCIYCEEDEIFYSSAELREHMVDYHECQHCSEVYDCISELQAHMHEEHFCPFCDEELSCEDSRNDHIDYEHNYHCCNRVFRSYHAYRQHLEMKDWHH
eukprot:TRINITY_DN2129_c1_g3_i4.p1 TRINITY_DN2129_c1_g3~~TRINITY_DN2129_c1_g3_i4.p1  ORF type:complete len:341 (-),score=6.43 TRINITY_DN2129_c1_g3_i4:124-1116(-)